MVTIGMRTYPSAYYHWATQHFVRLVRDIETAHTGNPTFNVQHRAFVTNAVLSAVAFLEARRSMKYSTTWLTVIAATSIRLPMSASG